MTKSKKCRCGQSKNLYCKYCSKLRMTLLLKNGNDHLKIMKPDGNKINPVWYSFLKYNNYDVYKIAQKMEANVRKHPDFSSATNVLLFYINGERNHYIKRVDL